MTRGNPPRQQRPPLSPSRRLIQAGRPTSVQLVAPSAGHFTKGRSRDMLQLAPRLPDAFVDVEHLEEVLTTPNPQVVADFGGLDGDLVILGVGGKIGPTLARLAKRAAPDKRIIGVARFSDKGLRKKLADWGVECLEADLLDRKQIEALP